MTERRLAMIDVKPGTAMESQSGLNQKWPKIYGAYRLPAAKPRVAAIICHPTSNFMNHYLIDPLADRGIACMGLNTRYAGNDVTLLMERAIQDLGAGVRWWREQGVEKVALVGNSGGASLAALYQSQAERLSIDATVDGRPIDLVPQDLPPADGISLCGAHPGRAITLSEWLDPALLDEADPDGIDPALDLYDPSNGPPYTTEFLQRFRAAQAERYRRLEEWVWARLRMLRDRATAPGDEAFIVYRTHADPRFLDLSLDANDREAGGIWGPPKAVNEAANAMGRFTTLTAFLSQFSSASCADGPRRLAETSIPVQLLDYTADQSVFPSSIAAWRAAIDGRAAGGKADLHVIKGGNHYLAGQPDLVATVADRIAGFAEAL